MLSFPAPSFSANFCAARVGRLGLSYAAPRSEANDARELGGALVPEGGGRESTDILDLSKTESELSERKLDSDDIIFSSVEVFSGDSLRCSVICVVSEHFRCLTMAGAVSDKIIEVGLGALVAAGVAGLRNVTGCPSPPPLLNRAFLFNGLFNFSVDFDFSSKVEIISLI